MGEGFIDIVKDAFRFLEAEYRFLVTVAEEDATRQFYSGIVTYENPTTIVGIDVDRGIASPPQIVRAKDRSPRGLWWSHGVSLDTIREYSITTQEEQSVLLSLRPEGDESRRQIESRIYNDLARLIGNDNIEGMGTHVRRRLAVDGNLLRHYAEPLLKGDFSQWLELQEFGWNRFIAREFASRRRIRKETSVEEVEAGSKESFDYLQALRVEYGHRQA